MAFAGTSASTPRESWLPSFSSLPLAGETTEGEAGCEDSFNSLLVKSVTVHSNITQRPAA